MPLLISGYEKAMTFTFGALSPSLGSHSLGVASHNVLRLPAETPRW